MRILNILETEVKDQTAASNFKSRCHKLFRHATVFAPPETKVKENHVDEEETLKCDEEAPPVPSTNNVNDDDDKVPEREE